MTIQNKTIKTQDGATVRVIKKIHWGNIGKLVAFILFVILSIIFILKVNNKMIQHDEIIKQCIESYDTLEKGMSNCIKDY